MKLNPNINVPTFLQTVQTCSGEVHFLTAKGDHLNLKSTLSQFVFTAVIAGKLQDMDCWITVSDPQDEILLRNYCI